MLATLAPVFLALLVTFSDVVGLLAPTASEQPIELAARGATEARSANGRILFQDYHHINLVTPDGAERREILDGPGDVGSAEWSPDGNRIAFVCHQRHYAMHPEQEICIAGRDYSNVTVLTDDGKADGSPSWSPDGEYLVFEKLTGDKFDWDTIEIFRMSTHGGDVMQLTHNEHADGSPDVSPDGTRIAYETESEGKDVFYSMTPDGRDQALLIEKRGIESGPRFSPDGRSLAYYLNHRVKILDLRTMESRDMGKGVAPRWSPDGVWLVYSYFNSKRQGYGLRKVRVIDGKRVTIVKGFAWAPDWGPSHRTR